MNKKIYLFAILIAYFSFQLVATVYFVDSQNGFVQAAGTNESHAWQSLGKVDMSDFKPGDIFKFACGGFWHGSLKAKSGASGATITYTCYGSDHLSKPRLYGSKLLNQATDWVKVDTLLWRTVEPITISLQGTHSDVGNLIFDGSRAGVKCWSKEELKTDGFFWFDLATPYLWLASKSNPAESILEVEAALRCTHVVDFTGVYYVVLSYFDPNGRHIMFYETTAKTTDFVISHNVFAYATETIFRDSRRGQEWIAEQSDEAQKSGEQGIAWVKHLLLNDYIWFQQHGDGRSLVLWQIENINDFRIYQKKSELDWNSMFLSNWKIFVLPIINL